MMSVSELAIKRDIAFLHSGVKKAVFDQLRTCGFMRHIHSRSFFWDLNDAVLFASKIVIDNESKGSDSGSISEKEEPLIDLTTQDHEKPSGDYSPLIAGDEDEINPVEKNMCAIF